MPASIVRRKTTRRDEQDTWPVNVGHVSYVPESYWSYVLPDSCVPERGSQAAALLWPSGT